MEAPCRAGRMIAPVLLLAVFFFWEGDGAAVVVDDSFDRFSLFQVENLAARVLLAPRAKAMARPATVYNLGVVLDAAGAEAWIMDG